MKEVRWLKDDPYVIMFREYQKVTDNGDQGPMSSTVTRVQKVTRVHCLGLSWSYAYTGL